MFPSLYEIAGSGLSIKLLSASTAFCDKTGICIGKGCYGSSIFFTHLQVIQMTLQFLKGHGNP